eukprot:TRINITY_DN7962_c0_g1_i1.p1 TRINITY_DN7962_c0_g1~~TRINITY_DN7962_c0_g1_i1.p1  ORF type:complete len:322 (-),score=73.08 TRINITY_DN7962_c0_g1_i1:76-996(-)
MADKTNIARDITTAAAFEEELQLSWKESGIMVVDVYSTNWGFCRALVPTFRRLYFEADESTKLRIVTVDATMILHELDNPKEREVREFKRPKNTDQIKETLPEFWKPFLQKQSGHAKPLFLFYKEGKFVKAIEGVDTPRICETIKALSTVSVPAEEFISNPGLLELWAEYFNAAESEVYWDKFAMALAPICKLTVPLNDAELATLKRGLNVDPKNNVVTAQELQNFVGTGTLLQAFTVLLPGYEARAIDVRLQQEESERRKQQQLAAQRSGSTVSAAAADGPSPEGVEGELIEEVDQPEEDAPESP